MKLKCLPLNDEVGLGQQWYWLVEWMYANWLYAHMLVIYSASNKTLFNDQLIICTANNERPDVECIALTAKCGAQVLTCDSFKCLVKYWVELAVWAWISVVIVGNCGYFVSYFDIMQYQTQPNTPDTHISISFPILHTISAYIHRHFQHLQTVNEYVVFSAKSNISCSLITVRHALFL